MGTIQTVNRLQQTILGTIVYMAASGGRFALAASHPAQHPKHPKALHDTPATLPLVAPPLVPTAPDSNIDTDEAPAPTPPAPIVISTDTHDVHAAAHAMGQAVREAYVKLGRAEAFHRVAIPYLVDADEATQSRHMGQAVAEMLAQDLERTSPFVVLDRTHVTQGLLQNHLTDPYRLDPQSAVAFGRLMGAQTLLTGAVEKNEETYTVHLRQFDIQTGRVLLESQAILAREPMESAVAQTVVERSINNAVWRSAIFPGWGQAYLKEPEKAAVFAGSGAVSLGAAVGCYAAAMVARSQYMENRQGTVGQRQAANDRLLAGNIALVVYGAVWLINLADVYFSTPPPTHVELN